MENNKALALTELLKLREQKIALQERITKYLHAEMEEFHEQTGFGIRTISVTIYEGRIFGQVEKEYSLAEVSVSLEDI